MSTPLLHRRTLLTTLGPMAAGAGVLTRRAFAQTRTAQTRTPEDPWPALAAQIFDGKPVRMDNPVLGIDAPYRAEDAAVVPVTLRHLAPAQDAPIRAITLMIDENPSPLAAKFTLGEASGIRIISTRVRVDSYTKLHAVAALADGALVGSERFVKAAGGCSAPAAKQEAGQIPLGTMRFRQFPPAAGSDLPEAELLVRHPNFTGMQMDQLTRLYVPAHYVAAVRIWQGDDLLLTVDSGISISENPAFRFSYQPNGARSFRAEVQDSEGKVFRDSWTAAPA
ncbi:MAG TPA: quinoprotein dehydrogenase-associated SoxYZ-like carrier [Rhodopila sp.]|nr:quinoprotein dehydrogenase-associated SoxYZ-like carrier [Rhodopila sp.]